VLPLIDVFEARRQIIILRSFRDINGIHSKFKNVRSSKEPCMLMGCDIAQPMSLQVNSFIFTFLELIPLREGKKESRVISLNYKKLNIIISKMQVVQLCSILYQSI